MTECSLRAPSQLKLPFCFHPAASYVNQTAYTNEWRPSETSYMWAQAISIITLTIASVAIAKEVFQLVQLPIGYLTNPENVIHLLVVVSVLIINLTHPRQCQCNELMDWERHLAAITIILGWGVMMMHIGRFPLFGLYIQMFATVAFNIAPVLLSYISLIIGFSVAMTLLFPDNKTLGHLSSSLLSTMVMMTGELEYKEYFDEQMLYPGSSHLV